MGRGGESQEKRQRTANRAEKKRDKEERRWRRRERGPGEVEMVSAEAMTGRLPSIEEAMRHIPVGNSEATPSRSASPIPCKLFVGGLSWDTHSETLRGAFAAHGEVASAVVVQDRDTGTSRGFGFVEMADRKDAAGAIEAMDGSELDGRRIAVNVATERRR